MVFSYLNHLKHMKVILISGHLFVSAALVEAFRCRPGDLCIAEEQFTGFQNELVSSDGEIKTIFESSFIEPTYYQPDSSSEQWPPFKPRVPRKIVATKSVRAPIRRS